MAEQKEHWHLSKRVPLALILTIFLQTSLAFWWFGKLEARVDSIETKQTEMVAGNRRQWTDIKQNVKENSAVGQRLARVEGTLAAIEAQLNRIASALDNIVNKN